MILPSKCNMISVPDFVLSVSSLSNISINKHRTHLGPVSYPVLVFPQLRLA